MKTETKPALISTAQLAERCGIRVCDVHNMRARHGAELVPVLVVGGVLFWTPDQIPLARAIYRSQRPQGKFRQVSP